MKTIGVATRAIAYFLCLALGPSSPVFALRITQSVQSGLEEEIAEALGHSPSQPAAGLEETERSHLEKIVQGGPLTVVNTIQEIDRKNEGSVYLLRKKPRLSQVRRLLKIRSREYEVSGVEFRKVPHVFIEIGGEEGIAGGVGRWETKVGDAEVKIAIHNHDEETLFPSGGDFDGVISEDWGQPRGEPVRRRFIYGARDGRLLEWGSQRFGGIRTRSQIRMFIWKADSRRPIRVWLPGKDKFLEELKKSDNYDLKPSEAALAIRRFYRAIESPEVRRVELRPIFDSSEAISALASGFARRRDALRVLGT